MVYQNQRDTTAVAEIWCGRRFRDSQGHSFGYIKRPCHPQCLDDPLFPLVYEDTVCVIGLSTLWYNMKFSGGTSAQRYADRASEIAKLMHDDGIRKYTFRHALRKRHTPPHNIVECDKLSFDDTVLFQTFLNWELRRQSERDEYGFPFWGD